MRGFAGPGTRTRRSLDGGACDGALWAEEVAVELGCSYRLERELGEGPILVS